MSRVLLNKVVKQFGDFTALHELDLEIREGEFLTLLGPSGCGKTTTLRLIAGFITPTRGTILLGEEDVTGVAPQHREIGMVFQDYALFPHMTIAENIAFGLKERRYPNAQIQARVADEGISRSSAKYDFASTAIAARESNTRMFFTRSLPIVRDTAQWSGPPVPLV